MTSRKGSGSRQAKDELLGRLSKVKQYPADLSLSPAELKREKRDLAKFRREAFAEPTLLAARGHRPVES